MNITYRETRRRSTYENPNLALGCFILHVGPVVRLRNDDDKLNWPATYVAFMFYNMSAGVHAFLSLI